MDQKEFQKFVSYLIENYKVYSPQEEDKQTIIKELSDIKKAELTRKLPFYGWKKFFVPEEEIMFGYADSNLTEPPLYSPPYQGGEGVGVALLGVNVLDLHAVLLYDLVFVNDPYYQARREKLLIIGYGPEVELQDGTTREIEQNDLENLPFDIFLYDSILSFPPASPKLRRGERKRKSRDSSPTAQNDKNTNFTVFAGSEKGKKVLDNIGYQNYKQIKFAGHKYNDFLENKMNLLRENLKNHHNPKIWEELGKICLECGKCTIACPTCFCFRIDDQAQLGRNPAKLGNSPTLKTNCDLPASPCEAWQAGRRQRCWDSCFYQEFSEISGEHKFLTNTAQRIHFWYFHKFARIPDEYNMMGCVGCRRCHTVCPVEINIKEVLEDIERS